MTQPRKPYRWLAEYYDRIFAFSGEWPLEARRAILGGILPKVEAACDIACGTGTTALHLVREGIRVYGVDLSPGMCRAARAKARAAKLPIRVIQGDMRTFRLPELVDLVLCEFDALNHVPRKADLGRVARSVARALKPGGHFYFDVNNRLAFREMWPRTWYLEVPGVAVVMQGGSAPELDRAWSNVHWFIQDGDAWRRHDERVDEVCWSPAEIRSALEAAGFTGIRRWDAAQFFGGDPHVRPGHRTYWLARKPRG